MAKLDGVDVRRVSAEALRRPYQGILIDKAVIGFLETGITQHFGQGSRLGRDVAPHAFQYLRLRPVDAAAYQQHSLVIDVEVVARFQAALRPVTDRRAEMRLVRRPVLGKSSVAVDAEHRFLRVDRAECAVEFLYPCRDIGDQLLELLPQHVVRRLVPRKPRAGVGLLPSAQELEKYFEVHAAM